MSRPGDVCCSLASWYTGSRFFEGKQGGNMEINMREAQKEHFDYFQKKPGKHTFMIILQSMLFLLLLGSPVHSAQVRGSSLILGRHDEDLSLSLCDSGPENVQTFTSELQHNLPFAGSLHLNLKSTDWMRCKSSQPSEEKQSEELEILNAELTLIGNGAHRQLSCLVTLGLQHLENQPVCHMVLVERLSSGVFADTFELEGLVDREVLENARVYGDTNLELPALHSQQSIVVLHAITKNNFSLSEDSQWRMQMKVVLPLHARYPPLTVEGHALVKISLPNLLFYCSQGHAMGVIPASEYSATDRTKGVWRQVLWRKGLLMESDVLTWTVPAGNPLHANFVAIATAFTALVGVVVLFVASSYSFRLREG